MLDWTDRTPDAVFDLHGQSVGEAAANAERFLRTQARVRRGGKTRDCSLMVLIPRFGDKPRRRTIYIGTENTYTLERYHAALEKAIEMRRSAEEAYEQAATKAKRADARAYKREAKATS